MRQRPKQITALVSTSLVPIFLMTGCASTKETVLPQDGPSMKAIYNAHFEEMGERDPRAFRGELGSRPMTSGVAALDGYTRDAYQELETTFPRLPNPALVMYVYPHLASEERVPVPGYVTTFPMYERVEYALPGEVPPARAQDSSTVGSERGLDQDR